MALLLFPALLVIVGALVYALASNGKAANLGLVAYGAGMLVIAYVLSTHMVRLP